MNRNSPNTDNKKPNIHRPAADNRSSVNTTVNGQSVQSRSANRPVQKNDAPVRPAAQTPQARQGRPEAQKAQTQTRNVQGKANGNRNINTVQGRRSAQVPDQKALRARNANERSNQTTVSDNKQVKAVQPVKKAKRQDKKDKPSIAGKLITKLTTATPSTGKKQKNDFIKPTDVVRIKGSYDKLFLILVIILTLFGIIMDFSASYAYAYNRYGDSYYFVKHQIIFACIGMAGLIAAMQFDYRWIRKLATPVFIGTIVLLVGVLMYGVASGVAQRWITIGPITFQPSEIMKLALVLMLALYVARNQDRITNYRNFKQSTTYGMIIPFLIVAVACGLVMLEKHFSGTIIIFAIGMVVIFSAGARRDWFIGGVIAAAVIILVAITFVPYARERIDMLLFPENYDPTGKIWQTLQGLYAIGSGGLFGVGLGNSRQKHMYVSQPQNDFVFSIIAEELGFAGATLVIVLFMLLIWRGFVIALKAPDTFSSLVVIGLISKVAIQALLNIAVVTNTIPNTGISLPFFSYGGTALMLQLGEMGIILSISRYSYQRKEDIE